jgi:hypothetical protein
MRPTQEKYVKHVVNAWRAQEATTQRGTSLWTDGHTIFSYGTAIVVRGPAPSELSQRDRLPVASHTHIYYNGTAYSATTTKLQRAILPILKSIVASDNFHTLDNLDANISGATLLRAFDNVARYDSINPYINPAVVKAPTGWTKARPELKVIAFLRTRRHMLAQPRYRINSSDQREAMTLYCTQCGQTFHYTAIHHQGETRYIASGSSNAACANAAD